ncbi:MULTISPECIES: hypothetical protein [unclassified Rothia (in: high G+C Gram-positive bacteria)]|nr:MULTISPECIES: hypothetical protein [unclassified Rothia (in: high G+C Gram-positive bacteria)]
MKNSQYIEKVINIYDGAGETLTEHAYDTDIEMKRKNSPTG